MNKRLIALAVALLLSWGAYSPISADDPGPCETTCFLGSEATYCICPEGTDRPGEESRCENWDFAGGCYYE